LKCHPIKNNEKKTYNATMFIMLLKLHWATNFPSLRRRIKQVFTNCHFLRTSELNEDNQKPSKPRRPPQWFEPWHNYNYFIFFVLYINFNLSNDVFEEKINIFPIKYGKLVHREVWEFFQQKWIFQRNKAAICHFSRR
jgi:hypothetical protein